MLYEPKPENAQLILCYEDNGHLTSIEAVYNNTRRRDAAKQTKALSKVYPGTFMRVEFEDVFTDPNEGTVVCFTIRAACRDGKTLTPYPAFQKGWEFVSNTEFLDEFNCDGILGILIPVKAMDKLWKPWC